MPRPKSKVRAFFRLTRIEHSAMLVIAVLAAEVIAGGGFASPITTALSLIAPVFISMGAFAINDYFDVKVDRANGRLDRPLVSGALKRKSALSIASACFAAGVAAAALISAVAFAIALIFALLAALYSYRLKEMLLVGNLYIAASMAIPFLFGDFVVSNAVSPTIALLCATVVTSGFAREIHGTIRDYEGDRKVRNVRSVPSYIGIMDSAYLALAFYVIAITLSVWLFYFAPPFFHNLFYIIAIAVVDGMLFYAATSYLCLCNARKAEQKEFLKMRNISLLAMGMALVIYLLSAFIFVA